MYNYEFYYYPGRYLNYYECSRLVSQMKKIASFEGKSIPSPGRDYLKDKIIVTALSNDRPVAYRLADFVKIPYKKPFLYIYDTISVPYISASEVNYDMLSCIINNLILRYGLIGNTYVCCTSNNFFDAQRFENDFYDVFPSIVNQNLSSSSNRKIIEYLISVRQDLLGISDSSEVDSNTYFINDGRIIQVGRTNSIRCLMNIFRSKNYGKSRQVFSTDNNTI